MVELTTVGIWPGTRTPPAHAHFKARSISPEAHPVAYRLDGNPLSGDDTQLPADLELGRSSRPRPRLLSWSGTLADGLFAADPRTWMGPGSHAFNAFCERVRATLRNRGWTLCFQPHARHVLSDAKSCREFLARRTGEPFEIALSPATMLEVSMLPALEDHLARQFEALGPIAALVILEDVELATDEDELPRRVPLGEGLMPRESVLALLREHVPSGTPIVVRDERLEAQRSWLGVG